MAGNQELIDSIVDPIAVKQVSELNTQIQALEASFVSAAKQALKLNGATGGSTSTSGFVKNVNETNVATKRLIKTQEEQARLTEKRLRIIQESTAQEIAALKKVQQETVKTGTVVSSLNKAQAQEAITATTASAANQRYGQQHLTTATQVAKETSSLSANTAAIETNTAVQSSAFSKVGQGLTKGLGYLRTLAYVLPGIGIAGLFTLAYGAIEKAVDALGLFNEELSLSKLNLDNFNELTKTANKQAGEQTTNLKILYKAATDVNNSMKGRIDAARELQKEFPTTFGLQEKENIINGNSSVIYNQLTKDILANARAKAAANKISELAAKQLDEDFNQQKINAARQAELAKVPGRVVERNLGTNSDALIATPKSVLIKQANDVVNARADAAIKISNQNKKLLTDQEAFLIKFAGGNNKIAEQLGGGDIDKQGKQRIEKVKDNSDELSKAEDEAQLRALADRKRGLDAELKLQEQADKEAEELRKKNFDDSESFLSKENSYRLLADEKNASDQLDLL